MKRISAHGGAPTTLYQTPDTTQTYGATNTHYGASWSPDGNSIVFAEFGKLYEVPARGGPAELLVSPEDVEQSAGLPQGQAAQLNYPHFLPREAGMRVLLYTIGSRERILMVHDLDSGRRAALGPGALPSYSASGHILFQANVRTFDIWALPFSLETLRVTGRAFPVIQNARQPTGASDQTLAYLDLANESESWRLVWRDRAGAELGTIGEPHRTNIRHTALSPDGRRVAVSAADGGNDDVWIHEVDRPVKTRLTKHEGQDWQPRWSPQGDRIAFSSSRSGARDVYTVRADGSAPPTLLYESPDFREDLNDWTADESILVFSRYSRYPQGEVFYLSRKDVEDGYEEVLFLQNAANARLSPDGRYLAYQSGESGRTEIYVRSFPTGANRQRVSLNGGTNVRWRRDGKELFYVEDDTLMAVPVTTSPRLRIGEPSGLFPVHRAVSGQSNYDVTPDGRRFVVPEPIVEGSDLKIRVVQNWYEEFRGREQD